MTELYNTNKDLKVEVPSDAQQVLLVAKYDILKHIRSRRLLSIGIILALVLVLITFLGTYNNPDPHNAANFIGNYAGFVNLLVVIGVTLFAGDSIVSEFQGRTGYLLFPNPVKKSSLYAGKFLASIAVLTFVIVVYYLVAIIIGLAYTGNFTELSVYSLLLALMYGAAATGVAFLISSVLKTSTASLVMTFFTLLLILSLIASVFTLAGIKPNGELTFAGGTISDILQKPYPVDTMTNVSTGTGGFAIHQYYPDVGLSVLVEIVWLAVSATLGFVAFKRREMVS